jgi:aminoglycoside N3'-acetyltransferase
MSAYHPPRFHPHNAPTPELAKIRDRFAALGCVVKTNQPHSVTMATRHKYQTVPLHHDSPCGYGDFDNKSDLYNYLVQLETVQRWLAQ